MRRRRDSRRGAQRAARRSDRRPRRPRARAQGETPSRRPRSSRGAPRAERLESFIDAQPWDSLLPSLEGLGCDPHLAIEKLRRFALQLLSWNASVSNLISRNDEPRIVVRHFAESLAPARWLGQSGTERWLDFGSGAGFPAIPLAIAGIGRHWTLVESRRPKVLFIRKSITEIKLEGIEVVHSRLESLLEPHAEPRYGGFTSRATLRLGPTLRLAARVVVPGGRAFLWKGSRREDEMAQDSAWAESWISDGVMSLGEGCSSVASFLRK